MNGEKKEIILTRSLLNFKFAIVIAHILIREYPEKPRRYAAFFFIWRSVGLSLLRYFAIVVALLCYRCCVTLLSLSRYFLKSKKVAQTRITTPFSGTSPKPLYIVDYIDNVATATATLAASPSLTFRLASLPSHHAEKNQAELTFVGEKKILVGLIFRLHLSLD